ncbi:DUF503 domain-containing protein [Thiovibrio sp. JS02]
METVLMVVDFHLAGCRSLKEKRHRLSGIRDRFGKVSNVAVCESDFHDSLQQAQWSFVVIGLSRAKIDQTLAGIEQFLQTGVDAAIIGVEVQGK